MKRNAMLARIEAAAEARYQKRLHASMDMLLQMCLDAAMIAANEVFNMGPSRVEAFCNAFSEDMEYTKAKLDQRLKQICGDKFQPWEERYR